jgi:hypothetical protein
LSILARYFVVEEINAVASANGKCQFVFFCLQGRDNHLISLSTKEALCGLHTSIFLSPLYNKPGCYALMFLLFNQESLGLRALSFLFV